ncbi:hypothetical protein J7F03_12170 [Streptomyces sp. ISL-43]|uniref:hypothetical protein n=1 Tax=Streptomyces sp. ISL-43 TaxID=2819183 RepID=UPI001BE78153|nr:hypothetical protein [Streptomyces sp. ISL-43]MBT2447815.1 hypothetical protein [Streptomyces sp. ISL-43]
MCRRRRITYFHDGSTHYGHCIYGEYGPTPPCDREHFEFLFVEQLTFADADTVIGMLRELCPNLVDGLLPVWIRNASRTIQHEDSEWADFRAQRRASLNTPEIAEERELYLMDLFQKGGHLPELVRLCLFALADHLGTGTQTPCSTR